MGSGLGQCGPTVPRGGAADVIVESLMASRSFHLVTADVCTGCGEKRPAQRRRSWLPRWPTSRRRLGRARRMSLPIPLDLPRSPAPTSGKRNRRAPSAPGSSQGFHLRSKLGRDRRAGRSASPSRLLRRCHVPRAFQKVPHFLASTIERRAGLGLGGPRASEENGGRAPFPEEALGFLK